MKKKEVNNSNNYIMFVFGITFSLILFMSVGYSTFHVNLVSGGFVTNVNPEKNVRVNSFSLRGTSNSGEVSNVDYDIDSINADLTLPNSSSSVSFDVSVKNYGMVELGIAEYSLPDGLANVLDVSFDGYTVGTKIRDDDDSCDDSANGCTKTIERTFTITVKYKKGAFNANNINFNNFYLNFKFIESYNITYSGFSIFKPTNEMKSILHGNTYSYNIGVHDSLTVKMNGIVLSSSEYTVDSNNILTIPNVTGPLDVIIKEKMLTINVNAISDYNSAILSSANFEYVLNGVSSSSKGCVDISVPYGSTFNITKISGYGLTDTSKDYGTVTSSITDSVVVHQFFYLKLTVSPANVSVVLNGVNYNVKDSISVAYDPGTKVTGTASKSGYISQNLSYVIDGEKQYNISLVEAYTLKISVNPTDANVSVTYNGKTYPSSHGASIQLPINTTGTVTASKTGYQSASASFSKSSPNVNLKLLKIYTVTLNSTANGSDVGAGSISSSITYNGQTSTATGNGSTSTSIQVLEGSSISYSVSAPYFQTYSSSGVISNDATINVNLVQNARNSCQTQAPDGSDVVNINDPDQGLYDVENDFRHADRMLSSGAASYAWLFTNTNCNQVPSGSMIFDFEIQYRIDATGKATYSTSSTVGGAACSSTGAQQYTNAGTTVYSHRCSPTADQIRNGVRMQVSFNKGNIFQTGYWYGARVTFGYVVP